MPIVCLLQRLVFCMLTQNLFITVPFFTALLYNKQREANKKLVSEIWLLQSTHLFSPEICSSVKIKFLQVFTLHYYAYILCVIAFYFSTIHNLSDCFPVALSRDGATISMMIPEPENVVSHKSFEFLPKI